MTDEELAIIRKRATAATPGLWEWNSYAAIETSVPKGHVLDDSAEDEEGHAFIAWIEGGPTQHGHGDELHQSEPRANAEFIAHARTDIPAMLDHIASLDASLGAACDEIATFKAENARLQGYERLMMLGNPQVRMAELEAENARMREIVVAVADGRISDTGYTDAGYCRCDPEYADEDDEHVGRWVHKPDCLITQARALLNQQPS